MDPTKATPGERSPWRRLRDRWWAGRAARSLLPLEGGEPTLAAPTSQPATAGQFQEPEYARWCAAIGEVPKLHRKQWEFVYILRMLEVHRMLQPGRRGLGFGVGREPLVAAIAATGPSVLATDLAPDDPSVVGWKASGEYGGSLAALNTGGLCPAAAFEERVRFEYADMRSADGLEGTYDFLWSSCALEHLGSLEAGIGFLMASLERLAPGGVAVHTTEFNVSSDTATATDGPVVLYRRRDLLALQEQIHARGFSMELNLHHGGSDLDRHIDRWPYESGAHLKMLYTRFATTSIGITVRRPGPGASASCG